MFLCIYSDFGVLIYKGFEFFFSQNCLWAKEWAGFFRTKIAICIFCQKS